MSNIMVFVIDEQTLKEAGQPACLRIIEIVFKLHLMSFHAKPINLDIKTAINALFDVDKYNGWFTNNAVIRTMIRELCATISELLYNEFMSDPKYWVQHPDILAFDRFLEKMTNSPTFKITTIIYAKWGIQNMDDTSKNRSKCLAYKCEGILMAEASLYERHDILVKLDKIRKQVHTSHVTGLK